MNAERILVEAIIKQSFLWLLAAMLLPFSAAVEAAADADSESENVSKLTGLDPTDVVGRIEFNYTYLEQKSGTERHSGVLKLDTDLDSSTVAGVDIPLALAQPEQGDDQKGLGDISANYRKRVHNTKSFSLMIGGSITLDSATDDLLGDNDNSVGLGMFTAWRHQEWMLASLSRLEFHQRQHDQDSIRIAPLIAYQPMAKYLSYITAFIPVGYRWETDDTLVNAIIALGKVMPNKDVYSFGTKVNISGPDNDDFVLQLGYRRLF